MRFETTKKANGIKLKIAGEYDGSSSGGCDSLGVVEVPGCDSELDIESVFVEGSEVDIIEILDKDFIASLYKVLEE